MFWFVQLVLVKEKTLSLNLITAALKTRQIQFFLIVILFCSSWRVAFVQFHRTCHQDICRGSLDCQGLFNLWR